MKRAPRTLAQLPRSAAVRVRAWRLLLPLLALASACSEDDSPPLLDDSTAADAELRDCVDKDGDGYGRSCDKGRDCDDNDPEVTNTCSAASCKETATAPGCACDEQGAVLDCGEQHSTIDDHALCGYGVQVCDEGHWSGCKLSAIKPTRTLTALVSPADCPANPCDPYCKEFTTTPAFTADTIAIPCDPNPSCIDGQRNQGELGIDCGGECAKSCAANVTLLDEDFTGSIAVTYEDNAFGWSSVPDGSSGVANNDQGTLTLGQQVGPGATSGAWVGTFTADAPVNVSFDWSLDTALTGQCLEVNTKLDGTIYATAVDWVAIQCSPGTQSGTFSFTSNNLASGEHTLLVGGWLSGNSVTAATTELKAEDYDAYSNPVAGGGDAGRGGDLGFTACSDPAECDYYQGYVSSGDTIAWDYTAPTDGNYTVALRLAATAAWTANVSVDAVTVRNLTGGFTGGGETFVWASGGSFPLTAGTHRLQIEYTSGTPHVNRMDITAPAVADTVELVFDNIRVTSTMVTSCADGVCGAGENCTNCPSDCGNCAVGAYCGDATCEAGETCGNCATDCGSCSSGCGDATCGGTETCSTCASDCGDCPSDCGNAVCDAGEDCTTCASDCGTCSCGNGFCSPDESCGTCAADCGACAICGDAICGSGETCGTCQTDCGACPVVPPSVLYLEAECPTTSANAYGTPVAGTPTYIRSNNNNTNAPGTETNRDRATYTASLAAGTYAVYFLVNTGANAADDSWYWRMTGATTTAWQLENNHTSTNNYIWIAGVTTVTMPTAGNYTLEIANREDGLRIDQVGFVKSGQPAPTGGTPKTTTNCLPPVAPSTCGNAVCNAGETCSSCAKDCGACAACGDSICAGAEDCTSCASDCGACMSAVTCGDAVCDASESCSSCAIDCGACPVCNNGTCDSGEDCSTCAIDCGACPSSPVCGDSTCDSVESCSTCALDCGVCPLPAACGDGTCNGSENCNSCALDCGVCGASVCGNSVCDGDETCDTCAADCSFCIPMCEPPPVTCGDAYCDPAAGEDCDTCADDCGACDPPPSCGNGTCQAVFGEDCDTCPGDCGACNIRECGDALCEPSIGESCATCPGDCGACTVLPTTVCGDTLCSIYENCDTCAADCGACPFWGSGDPFNGGIISTGSITVSDRVTVNGDISGKNFSFGSDSTVNGNVDIEGNALLNHRVKINGTVRVEGSISAQSAYTATAQEIPAQVTIPTLPSVTVTPGTTDVTVPNGGLRVLAPGQYRNVTVGSNGTLSLSSGTYHFTTFFVSPDAIVNLNVSAGPIDIRVSGNVEIESRGKFNISGGSASQVGLYSGGNVILRPQNTFPAAIYAPFGTVTVYSNSSIRGIAGANVKVEPDITLGLASLNTGWAEPAPPPTVPIPVCGDTVCTPDTGESCAGCSSDCGACETLPSCGDSTCNTTQTENCRSCAADCGPCGALATCGNGACDTAQAESCSTCDADCGVCPPPPGNEPISVYASTEHFEEFDVSTECAFDQAVTWASYSWEAITPSDSKIEIYFRSADTELGLATAPEVQIVVAAASAANDGWRYGPPAETGAMTIGLQYVDSVLKAEEMKRHQPFARLRYQLIPSSDGASAPELINTALQSSCEVVQ